MAPPHPCALLALAAAAHGATLTQPESVTSYPYTLIADEYTLEMANPALTLRVRGYNPTGTTAASMPVGPTFRMKAGDTVTIVLQNDLEANSVDSYTLNTFNRPSTTNLHTHGLHVDSDSPQDNVLMAVAPGESYEYKYTLPADHMGGTHWYHAHHHGNTALQVGCGMVGMIVVDDAEDEVPPSVRALSELLLMLQYFEPDEVRSIAAEMDNNAGDGWSDSGHSGVTAGVGYLTANGQYQPEQDLESGQWTRVRMAFSGRAGAMQLTLSDTNSLGCEWKLLAKDGIYVDNAPRTLSTVHLAPGNRADVIVKCTGTGSFTFQGSVEEGGPGGDGQTAAAAVVTFNVISSDKAAAGDIAAFTAKKPAYLAHVHNADGVTYVEHTLQLARATRACQVRFDNTEKLWDNTAHGSMALGSVQKWTLNGNDGHPFHIHVNSFQLGSDASDPAGYYQPGDWHDVFYRPDDVTAGTIYFSVDNHQGKAVLHCHFLEHEDRGCMAFVDITGSEGTTTGLQGSALVTSETPATTPTPPTPEPPTPEPPTPEPPTPEPPTPEPPTPEPPTPEPPTPEPLTPEPPTPEPPTPEPPTPEPPTPEPPTPEPPTPEPPTPEPPTPEPPTPEPPTPQPNGDVTPAPPTPAAEVPPTPSPTPAPEANDDPPSPAPGTPPSPEPPAPATPQPTDAATPTPSGAVVCASVGGGATCNLEAPTTCAANETCTGSGDLACCIPNSLLAAAGCVGPVMLYAVLAACGAFMWGL